MKVLAPQARYDLRFRELPQESREKEIREQAFQRARRIFKHTIDSLKSDNKKLREQARKVRRLEQQARSYRARLKRCTCPTALEEHAE